MTHRTLFNSSVRRTTRWLALAVLTSLAACERADDLSGGIDLQDAPPAVDGASAAPLAAADAPSSDARAADARLPLGGTPVAATSSAPPNYATPTSSAIIATSGPSDTARLTVRPTERPQLLADADRAFANRSGCAEAVRLYSAFPKPTDINSAAGTDWVGAQLRIAQCSIELREWNRSLDAIALVKASRPREWSAPYFEGQVYCQMGQYDRGAKTFRDLTNLLGTLSTSARQAVTLLSKYGTATCDRLDYESSRQPERNRDQLELFVGEYEEFIKGTEALQAKAGLPADYSREFGNALKSARENYAKYAKP